MLSFSQGKLQCVYVCVYIYTILNVCVCVYFCPRLSQALSLSLFIFLALCSIRASLSFDISRSHSAYIFIVHDSLNLFKLLR